MPSQVEVPWADDIRQANLANTKRRRTEQIQQAIAIEIIEGLEGRGWNDPQRVAITRDDPVFTRMLALE